MDMSRFIVAKSDQLNADDLLGGPRTITITGVRGTDAADQPVSVNYEGDAGKPYKPCKSMRRVMVHCWGKDAAKYAGRSMTVYCDPDVQFGGMKVGGIRISHMTHIDGKRQMALTATRGKKGLFTVHPLADAPQTEDAAVKWADAYIAKLPTLDLEAFNPFLQSKAAKLMELKEARPELYDRVTAAVEQRKNELVRPQPSFTDDDTSFDSQPAGGAGYDGV